MAQKVIFELTDDIDGATAHETVSFAVRGVEYEIDLSEANAAGLDAAFAYYVSHARRAGGRKSGSTPAGVEPKVVRAWAAERGVELGLRGRIPHQVIERYRTEVRG